MSNWLLFFRFVKNLSADKINISAIKGEGELTNLELDEKLLSDLLELPSWMVLKMAFCNRVLINIPWTKLKSMPIVLVVNFYSMSVHVIRTNYFYISIFCLIFMVLSLFMFIYLTFVNLSISIYFYEHIFGITSRKSSLCYYCFAKKSCLTFFYFWSNYQKLFSRLFSKAALVV